MARPPWSGVWKQRERERRGASGKARLSLLSGLVLGTAAVHIAARGSITGLHSACLVWTPAGGGRPSISAGVRVSSSNLRKKTTRQKRQAGGFASSAMLNSGFGGNMPQYAQQTGGFPALGGSRIASERGDRRRKERGRESELSFFLHPLPSVMAARMQQRDVRTGRGGMGAGEPRGGSAAIPKRRASVGRRRRHRKPATT